MAKAAITKWSQVYDASRTYVSDSPSPAKFAALLKGVDAGEIHKLWLLQQEMEAKSLHFKGVCQTRRNSLMGLEWTIEPDEQSKEKNLAKEAADYCQETLDGIASFSNALRYLSRAIGPNVSVVETVWNKAAPVDFITVPGDRLRIHPFLGTAINVITEQEPNYGIPTDIPGKFIVFHPESNGWFPFRSTLTHSTVWPYLVINFSSKDWMAFSELYGNPIRVAHYDDAIVDADRETIMEMLENMGSDVAGRFPKGVDVELLTVDGKGEAFERAIAWAESKLSIGWLGNNLTTEIKGDTGSRAAAEVHENTRLDILVNDKNAEAECLQDKLLRPMVELRFPGRNAPVPKFVRKLERKRDIEGERLTLEQLRYAGERGLRVDEDVVYEKLGLAKPTTPEPKENTGAETAATINELTLGIERAARAGDLALVNALREKIAELLGVPLPPLTELPKATDNFGRPVGEDSDDGRPINGEGEENPPPDKKKRLTKPKAA